MRIRNKIAPGTEGGVTRHLPDGLQMSIYEAAREYEKEGVPLIVLAGKEYGTGSSRDWAAKGTLLLGIKAVIAQSYERIHRSNLIGMGVLPLEFLPGEGADQLGLTGEETFSTEGLAAVVADFSGDRTVAVTASGGAGGDKTFKAKLRIDTPREADYYQHGGILLYVLRRMLREG